MNYIVFKSGIYWFLSTNFFIQNVKHFKKIKLSLWNFEYDSKNSNFEKSTETLHCNLKILRKSKTFETSRTIGKFFILRFDHLENSQL